MVEHLSKLFKSQNHQEIMLVSLLSISTVIYMVLAWAALYLGLDQIFWIKLTVSLFIALLFIPYFKSHNNASIIVILLFLILEIDGAIEMLNQDIFTFVSIYPFCIIFGFFFFFQLNIALWISLIHFIFWIGLTLVKDQALLLSDINMFITSIVVVLLGIFYRLSREVVYDNYQNEKQRKATTLKEIHHRIKNNLNMIASIIGLQILNLEKTTPQNAKEILIKSKLRIEVVAMIHQSLYHQHNLEEINFKNYTKELIHLILRTYNKKVHIEINSNVNVLKEESMLRLGIIINELFTNSIKHAFSATNQKNHIQISLMKKENTYTFKYHNPFNIQADIDKILHSETLGIKLIQLTVKQMDGILHIEQNGGLVFSITFKH